MDPSDATFIVEHDDASAGLRKHYVLSFWAIDGSVAMYDSHAKRQFLKRVVPPEKPPFDAFFLGGTVVVCSRPLKVVDYADETTRRKYAAVRGNALLLVKPDAYYHLGKIISMVYNAGLGVGQLRMLRLTGEEAAALHSISGADKRGDSSSYLTTENTTALEIVGDDVISRLHTLAGPANPTDAREVAPSSIRATFGRDRVHNAVHVSLSQEIADKELAFIFDRSYGFTAVHTHCAMCIIKPHAVAEKRSGAIIDSLLKADFEISAARSLVLATKDVGDYLEAYRSVYPEYEKWIAELSSGPAIVLEVRGDNVVDNLREFVGPYDPEIAKILHPTSTRAVHGLNAVRNAVHVTDLTNDGPLESKFFFYVLE